MLDTTGQGYVPLKDVNRLLSFAALHLDRSERTF